MSFVSESISTEFGVVGITIGQTLLNSFDPYSGMDIDTTTFQNTNQGLEDSNDDGRIELGMFSFDDDNIASDNFPKILSSPFVGINKTNMVNNGDCRFVEKALVRDSNEIPVIVKPEGGWKFLSLIDMDYQSWLGNYTNSDGQGFTGYGGRYAYVPLSLEIDGDAGLGTNYWGNVFSSYQDLPLGDRYASLTTTQDTIDASLTGDTISGLRTQYGLKIDYNDAESAVPHIAAWISTDEAYSNRKCLCFMNFQIWTPEELIAFTRSPNEYFIFNWLAKQDQRGGAMAFGTFEATDFIEHNQYKVLNQVQKIYDKFNDEPLNPHSSLKIRFKMKTTHVLPPGNDLGSITENEDLFFTNPLDTSAAPQVEIGILQSQFEEIPNAGSRGVAPVDNSGNNYDDTVGFDGELRFKAPGSWNSKRYFNGNTYEEKRDSELGGMSRFQNSKMDEWETFEFTYNLREEHNNRGKIYGVPYGGSFNDERNEGSVEIMLNHNFAGNTPSPNPGEIFFKAPNYQEAASANRNQFLYFIPPEGVPRGDGNSSALDDISVYLTHGDRSSIDYMTVATGLGETGTYTGLQDDGRFLEAYLMFTGNLNLIMNGVPDYGEVDEGGQSTSTDMVLAYWDGERWSYDDNSGYEHNEQTFIPTNECFIIARVYASQNEPAADGSVGSSITGIDKYINNELQFPTDGIGNLALFLQSGNNFNGRVLIDDIECFESYEFIPEVDVRKKKSVGNYGIADLTKYYDKELQPNEYLDTTGPLEAQFYFYPQYPTDELLDIQREVIYQDFRKGMFYINDINWGDGTNNEFTSKPEQINENTSLYHTYETNGIFEVTGTMMRVKVDNDDNILGVAYNKRFKLRININEGLDEDFQHFGSNGYSFIPYKNTLPIVGGISKQSNYYKKIKRQLGFLGNEKIKIEFKNKSDELKTELALLKIENQNDGDLEVLPNYMIERFDDENTQDDTTKIYNGISPIKEELGKGIGDCDLTNIKYYNEPKSIWEMFGFKKYELNAIGNPDEERYWKNIIPEDYSIFNREELTNKLIITMQGRQDGEDGTPPHYNIIVNGVTYYDGFITNALDRIPDSVVGSSLDYDFNIPIDRTLDVQEIRIKYDNNGTPPLIEGDRNLYVNSIKINNVEFDGNPSTHDDINVYYDATDIYNYMENNPDQTSYNENGVSGGGAMAWDGNMVFEIPTSYFDKQEINTFSEQEWLGQNEYGNTYYYPVLPKYGQDGKFIENNYPNNKILFPLEGNITNDNESAENLLVSIVNEKNDVETFDDKSGNKNYGFSIEDFSPKYDDETLRVGKNKIKSIFKTSKQNGAF